MLSYGRDIPIKNQTIILSNIKPTQFWEAVYKSVEEQKALMGISARSLEAVAT